MYIKSIKLYDAVEQVAQTALECSQNLPGSAIEILELAKIVISINDQAQRAGVVVDTDHSMFVKTGD
jgi:hypothetical protein